MEPALVVDHVSKYFGGLEVLADVNMRVGAGERRVLIGPNGAGKTTLFNVITGFLKPTAGKIRLFGRDVTTLPAYRRAAMGMRRTFQITNLFPNLSVTENLLLSLKAVDTGSLFSLKPLRGDKRLSSSAEILIKQCELWEKRDVVVRELAYGEQRQVEILMALAQKPVLLLLDEFSSGLSSAEIVTVSALLKLLPKEITVIMIEHDMDVAFELGEVFSVLYVGSVFAEGSAKEIKGNSMVQEIYLGEAP